MEHKINVGGKQVLLTHSDFDDSIDIEDLSKIDYSNIVGEALTIDPLKSKIGAMLSEAEYLESEAKMALSVYEADFKMKCRKESTRDEGFATVNGTRFKVTEKALETAHCSDREWQRLKNQLHIATRNHGIVKSMLNGVEGKAFRLQYFIPKVTPEEFIGELVEGKINGYFLKKAGKEGGLK